MDTYETVDGLIRDAGENIQAATNGVISAHDALVEALPAIKAAVDSATTYNKSADILNTPKICVSGVIAKAISPHTDKISHECRVAANMLHVIVNCMDEISPPRTRDGGVEHSMLSCSFKCIDGNTIKIEFVWSDYAHRYVARTCKYLTVLCRDNSDIVFGTNGVLGVARLIVVDYNSVDGKPLRACLVTQTNEQLDAVYECDNAQIRLAHFCESVDISRDNIPMAPYVYPKLAAAKARARELGLPEPFSALTPIAHELSQC